MKSGPVVTKSIQLRLLGTVRRDVSQSAPFDVRVSGKVLTEGLKSPVSNQYNELNISDEQ